MGFELTHEVQSTDYKSGLLTSAPRNRGNRCTAKACRKPWSLVAVSYVTVYIQALYLTSYFVQSDFLAYVTNGVLLKDLRKT